jgi:hypothetical protein
MPGLKALGMGYIDRMRQCSPGFVAFCAAYMLCCWVLRDSWLPRLADPQKRMSREGH